MHGIQAPFYQFGSRIFIVMTIIYILLACNLFHFDVKQFYYYGVSVDFISYFALFRTCALDHLCQFV